VKNGSNNPLLATNLSEGVIVQWAVRDSLLRGLAPIFFLIRRTRRTRAFRRSKSLGLLQGFRSAVDFNQDFT